METIGLAKPKIFTTWAFTETAGLPAWEVDTAVLSLLRAAFLFFVLLRMLPPPRSPQQGYSSYDQNSNRAIVSGKRRELFVLVPPAGRGPSTSHSSLWGSLKLCQAGACLRSPASVLPGALLPRIAICLHPFL